MEEKKRKKKKKQPTVRLLADWLGIGLKLPSKCISIQYAHARNSLKYQITEV